jgi:hypothetical protein
MAIPHTASDSMINAALKLARDGFRVFPAQNKIPLIRAWQKAATVDEDQIEQWWRDWPNANVCIATGDGLLVLDVDVKKNGDASLSALELEHGDLPKTVYSRTGGGGWHYFFKVPPGVRNRNSAERLGPGLDTRGDGGFIVAPPSSHQSGGRYKWEQSPGKTPIADCPEWIINALNLAKVIELPKPSRPVPSQEQHKRARAYLARLSASVSGQGGHQALWTATLSMVRGFELSTEDAFSLLASDFNPRCDPPWDEEDLRHKINDAANNSSTPWGYLLHTDVSLDSAPRHTEEPPDYDIPPPTDIDRPMDADVDAAFAEVIDMPERQAAPVELTNSYASICTILRNRDLREKVLGPGALEYDEMSLTATLARRPILDEDIGKIRENCERMFSSRNRGIQFSTQNIEQAIVQISRERPYHPVKDYLAAIQWDGVSRIEDLAVQAMHQSESSVEPLLIRKWLISCVARAMRPGCKVDTVLVLVGPQGLGKSTFFRLLMPGESEWFTDTTIDIRNKDSYMVMRRVWVLEWAELDAIRRAKDANAVKAFITSQEDVFRPPYERGVRQIKRSNVIVGTTNDYEFLSDDTGNRRFWPIHCLKIDRAWIAHNRDQIWAEAREAYMQGEAWWLSPEEEVEVEQARQRFHRVDPWLPVVDEYLVGRNEVNLTEILSGPLDVPIERQNDHVSHRLIAIMRQLNWSATGRRRANGRQIRIWTREE